MVSKGKFVVNAVVMIMIASMLVSCNNSKQTVTQGNDVKQGGLSGKLISKQPLEMSIFCMDYKPFSSEYPVFKKAAELTNISLKGVVNSSSSDEKQMLNLMIASGEVADIVQHWGAEDFAKYGTQGVFVPLNDLIDKYAPNIKDLLEEKPDLKRIITAADGNIYYIPFIPDGIVAEGWFIRKDWLDNLGLKVPTSVEEYYHTLQQFRDNDPNKNGKKDEIPFFVKSSVSNATQALSSLYFLWDAKMSWYVKDGTVHYGPYEPEFKLASKNVADWYKEKLIDNEVYTRGLKAREKLLGDNIGGSTHDWFGSTAEFNNSLKDKIPGFEFVPFAPPTGKENSRRDSVQPAGWALSTKNKHLVESIKYFDFWFSVEGRRLMNFGIEGTHYDMIDGKPIFKENVLKGDKSVSEILHRAGAQLAIGFQQDYAYEEQWSNSIALKGIKEYTEKNYPVEQFPQLSYLSDEEKKLKEIMTAVETYRNEMAQKWTFGTESVDNTHENYLENLRKMKIDEAIKIQQVAYDRIFKK